MRSYENIGSYKHITCFLIVFLHANKMFLFVGVCAHMCMGTNIRVCMALEVRDLCQVSSLIMLHVIKAGSVT